MRRFLDKLQYYLAIKKRRKYDIKRSPLAKLIKLKHQSQEGRFDLIIFGDSVTERVSRTDIDQTQLGKMILANLPNQILAACLSHSAYTLEHYYFLLATMKEMSFKVSKVLIPINLRSFSPQWDLNPLYKCIEHIEEMKKYIAEGTVCSNNPGSTLSINEFFGTKVKYPKTNISFVSDFIRILKRKPKNNKDIYYRKQQIFIYHYMHELLKDHIKLNFLNKIVDLCQINNIKPYFYLVPINHRAGEKYVGLEFNKVVDSNVAIISDLILKLNRDVMLNHKLFKVKLVNTARMLEPEHFFSEDEATEHLNEKGRRYLSRVLTEAIIS